MTTFKLEILNLSLFILLPTLAFAVEQPPTPLLTFIMSVLKLSTRDLDKLSPSDLVGITWIDNADPENWTDEHIQKLMRENIPSLDLSYEVTEH
ncbi:hypothetical protein I7I53_08816 [Histoplasma capsulatum var. duboisii H88]|uniref:Secreted protein n=1 Tax=Ajellomyces capsulatus (strain H88) TaxID=544711 RepID=A0A8A1L8H3_AJEC8|nr:hypothetical protein I7I53_08816 [Histoplasma capsulatum var. duboisii H88]